MSALFALWRERLHPTTFIGQVTVLATGAALAQTVGLLAAPVLTRLYSPSDFGAYALYVALLALAAPVVSGRYELAVVPAESDDEGLGLVLVAVALTTVAGGVVALFLAGGGHVLLGRAGLAALEPYWWLIPVGVLLVGSQQALRYHLIRRQRYARLSGIDVTQATVASVSQVTLGVSGTAGPEGILVGQVAGMIVAMSALVSSNRRDLTEWRGRHVGSILRHLRGVMWRYRRFPAYLPWGGLLDALGQRLPVLLLAGFYGPVFLGFYALAERLLRAPASLLAQASSQVLFARLADPRSHARLGQLLRRWGLGMAGLCLLPLLLLHYFGEPAFALVLGERWRVSGQVAARLAPYIVATLVVSPPSTLLVVADRQGLLLAMQAMFCAGGLGALWLSHALNLSGLNAVSVFALVQCTVYALYFAVLLQVGNRMAQTADTDPCAA